MEENSQLLLQVVFYLLLALAIWASYELLIIKKQRKEEKGPSIWMITTFIIGILTIIFLIISSFFEIFKYGGYSFFIIFVLSFFQLIIEGWGGLKDKAKKLMKFKRALIAIIILWIILNIIFFYSLLA